MDRAQELTYCPNIYTVALIFVSRVKNLFCQQDQVSTACLHISGLIGAPTSSFHSSNSLWHIFAFFPLPHRGRRLAWEALHTISFSKKTSRHWVKLMNCHVQPYLHFFLINFCTSFYIFRENVYTFIVKKSKKTNFVHWIHHRLGLALSSTSVLHKLLLI